MTTSHVLLDLDGTLSDSSLGIGRSLRHAFTTCGYPPPTDDEVRHMIGPPFEISFPTVGIPVEDVQRVIDAYRERYDDVGLFENTPYDGVAGMLDALRNAGHTLSLATAKPEATAVRIVEHFGFAGYFEVQAGASNEVGGGRRSKAEVIHYALARLDIAEAHLRGDVAVVMVGDRNHDVEGALLNLMPCIGVTWGFGSADELHDAGATVIVDTPSEVAAAVAKVAAHGRR
jgi:phosphoglycolate phosphatase